MADVRRCETAEEAERETGDRRRRGGPVAAQAEGRSRNENPVGVARLMATGIRTRVGDQDRGGWRVGAYSLKAWVVARSAPRRAAPEPRSASAARDFFFPSLHILICVRVRRARVAAAARGGWLRRLFMEINCSLILLVWLIWREALSSLYHFLA